AGVCSAALRSRHSTGSPGAGVQVGIGGRGGGAGGAASCALTAAAINRTPSAAVANFMVPPKAFCLAACCHSDSPEENPPVGKRKGPRFGGSAAPAIFGRSYRPSGGADVSQELVDLAFEHRGLLLELGRAGQHLAGGGAGRERGLAQLADVARDVLGVARGEIDRA